MSVIPADPAAVVPAPVSLAHADPAAFGRAPRLSIVIPVYNEAATVQELVRRVVAAPLPEGIGPDDREIVCVNDASTDGTAAKLDELPGLFPGVCFRVIHKKVNQGKGAALRDGFAAARGEFVLVQDADLEYDPEDYPKLLQPMVDGRADVVYGSRFIGEPHRVLYFWHTVGNKGLTFLSNMLTNLNLTDMEVGYKAFRGSVLRRITLKCDRFGFEPEVTAKVAGLRCRIYEVGISYSGRTYEEGKKIGWRDGFRAIWCILKYR
jgi:glycosyltransferase involved in cell wall biosynthesis